MRFWLLILTLFSPVLSNNEVQMSQTHAPAVDALIVQLKIESWGPEEIPCMEKTVELLENVKNFTMWATWVWNANMLPVSNLYGTWTHMGNFDQCMNPPLEIHQQFRTQFCIANFVLSDTTKTKMTTLDAYGSTEEYLNAQTKYGLPVNQFHWGVCVPASCQPYSVAKITRILYQRTNYVINGPNVTVNYCQVAGVEQQFTIGFYIFFVLLAMLILTAAVSTYKRRHVSDDEQPNSIDTIISTSFCIRKNHQDLTKRRNKEEILVMNGIRSITAVLIVLGHVIFFTVLSGTSNIRDFEKEMDGVLGLFLHFDIAVDTFFTMSGLLYMKGLLFQVDRQKNVFAVLWKRYIRLIGPFATVILYKICVLQYTGSGPTWPKYLELEPEVCTKTWPLSLLMLNSNTKYICHSVTWYIACDYQLAILGTVLFYFYQKDRRLGMTAFGTAAVFSLIIPGVLTYWHQLPALHFLDLSKLVIEMRDYWEVNYTYTPSYSRAGAYLVGIAMGYLMTVYKPIDHRKSISKTWSIIGTGASLTVMMCMLELGQFYIGREYYPLEVVFTAVTNRIVWAFAICSIIGLCEYGTVPVVSNFLGLSIFTPLSHLSYGIYLIHFLIVSRNKYSLRSPAVVSNFLGLSIFTPLSHLSYGIYLIHFLIVSRNKYSLRSPGNYDRFYLMTEAIGTLVMSTALSYVMWLLVEAPMINICNYLLFTKTKSSEESKVSEKNGILDQRGHIKTKTL